MVIEEAIAGGAAVDLQRTPLVLPPDTRDLEIHYTALSLKAPQKNRFRYRLVGQHLIDSYGVNFQGALMNDYVRINPSLEEFRAACWEAVDSGEPRYLKTLLLIEPGYITTARGIMCPLSSEPGIVDGLFGIAVYTMEAASLEELANLAP